MSYGKKSFSPSAKQIGRVVKMIKNRERLYYGDLLDKALTYILNGWTELQNYRMDGHYTIDNMLAERVIIIAMRMAWM